MPPFVRIIIAITVFLMVTVFCNILISLLLPESMQIFGMFLPWIVAFFAARFVWQRLKSSESGGLLTSIVTGAFTLGAIGFVGGFVGPLIFTPEANQGPLLGIFITGPGGFALGAVLGALWWKFS